MKAAPAPLSFPALMAQGTGPGRALLGDGGSALLQTRKQKLYNLLKKPLYTPSRFCIEKAGRGAGLMVLCWGQNTAETSSGAAEPPEHIPAQVTSRPQQSWPGGAKISASPAPYQHPWVSHRALCGHVGPQLNSGGPPRFVLALEQSSRGREVGQALRNRAPSTLKASKGIGGKICAKHRLRRRLLGSGGPAGARPPLSPGYRCFWKALGSPSAGSRSAQGTCSKASREIHRSSPDLHLSTSPRRSGRMGKREKQREAAERER